MIAPVREGTSPPSTIVVALGGNALLPAGESGDIHQQFGHTRESLGAIVALARAGWRIAIVHGNGPQIGDELLRNERARDERPPLPLGVLVAATAGWIGYMIQQSLQNALTAAQIDRSVVTVITQVLVDPDDARTHTPSKPIGHTMERSKAEALARDLDWHVAEVAGGWRRLVPSPVPLGIVEGEQVRSLVESGSIVITAGGGGTPVYRHPDLGLEGIDGVVDKDRAATVLAHEIGADTLVILTNVEGVYRGFGSGSQELLRELPLAEAERMLRADEFGRGSMRPKVEAAIDFLRGGGGRACIARLDRGLEAVEGRAGTAILQ